MDTATKGITLSYLLNILQGLAQIIIYLLHNLYIYTYSSTTLAPIICQTTIIAMKTKFENQTTPCDPFDTDSGMIGIDNRCSACITNVRSDIPGELTECNKVVKGFGGPRAFKVWSGTISWSWEDDN